MKRAVHKHTLVGTDQVIWLPEGAEVVSVGWQPHAGLCLWSWGDQSGRPAPRRFAVLMTGECTDLEHLSFIGRATRGSIELHIFEVVG